MEARSALPEELVLWEILVRLPPKTLLRCRLVCRSWRRLTSTHQFLLAHHRRQPSIPVLTRRKKKISDIVTFDRRDADPPQLHPVAQLRRDETFHLLASCDGVLILRSLKTSSRCSICNPTTRQYADLPLISGSMVMGFYHHRLTGEYRILLHREEEEDLIPNPGYRYACYVYTLGSSDMPRRIGWLEASSFCTPVLLQDSLHWFSTSMAMILVFDTTAESSRWIRAPANTMGGTLRIVGLFEMDGALGMYRHDYNKAVVEIYVLQDYEREVWSLKYRVELPLQEINARGYNIQNTHGYYWNVLVSSKDGDLLVLAKSKHYLFYIDTDGKLLSASQCDGSYFLFTLVKHKHSLVPHAFFPLLEEVGDVFLLVDCKWWLLHVVTEGKLLAGFHHDGDAPRLGCSCSLSPPNHNCLLLLGPRFPSICGEPEPAKWGRSPSHDGVGGGLAWWSLVSAVARRGGRVHHNPQGLQIR
uniref:F-box domain-containing protein n=1 Tax=Leersia perrieri TaxID=77586 RepID=A0A0D9W2J2_9ORYZ